MAKRKHINSNTDPQEAASLSFDHHSGGQKNLMIGPKFLPISTGTGAFTTDATTAKQVEKGTALAIYNNSVTLYSITCGLTSSVAAAASGVVDAAGNASVACKPGDWTYVSVGLENWIITQNAALLVYIIADDTKL